ncbi:kinesin-domain-containing protein [Pseudovirgaria hyperparasitica]|uniref:Kinesin-like protein n=1 Tax=Pseudovirgaria hyperparasitica TaxID=470096 RepID=A0A6A6W7E1_9PEZI|nr:kinesin-domain-containing protein [Pseudovirgaria hyperparasitica]KAF2758465.1 kinesin-domain-containing protein [Pseudovirgaria hyperparasitica]
MATNNTVKVVARFRPQNKVEIASGGEPIVRFESDDTCAIKSQEASGSFTFDRVFGMDSRQTDVFDFSIKHTVDDILQGYNGTVFAYGQTGAGKSYTMMGGDIDDDESKGIIPRIVEQIFASIMGSSANIEYTVRVSYMEIYMERIRDLLRPTSDNLPVHEEKNRGVYVKGLVELYVSSVGEVYEVMRRGGQARAVAATNMNQESSRSHSIFVITVTQKNVDTGSAKTGQLFLVDLAGSEKVGKTGASGQTLEEAKKINKSLSALGMVINSLTDGKSTHIPYRDSKLTRILQESLGGNSRTTLIINCSPSSYNDVETVSTLRFGERAKAIKNKAKVNAELSPAELKALLKKAQSEVMSYETYTASLTDEIQLWRGGSSVPQDQWVPAFEKGSTAPKRDTRPRSDTPSKQIADVRRMETPSRPDSRMEIDRAGTPSAMLEKDEKDEFLRRENEFQDQLAEKESALANSEATLRSLREELQFLREREGKSGKENERLVGEVNELKMQVEKIHFETKEQNITMDGLKESNAELTSELDEVKQQLLDAKIAAKEAGVQLDEKEKKKAERMAQMMAGFDLGGDVFSDNERNLRKIIEQVDSLYEVSASGEAVSPDHFQDLRQKLRETQGIVRQAELSVTQRGEQDDAHVQRHETLEQRLSTIQREYEELLEGKLGDGDVEAIRSKLADAYTARQEGDNEHTKGLKQDIQHKLQENQQLRSENESLQQRLKSSGVMNGVAAGGSNGKTVQQQIADFDIMKKSLMRDLQNRCERVVELEISLDETREQYNNVLRSSNNRQQQKKMAFLERNLEQLTVVQRQLVEQNSGLKKEVAIAERKLIARNERIQSLEALLQDSQEKLTAANHRFEVQLQGVKERLEAVKANSTRGLGGLGSPTSNASFAFGGGSRIAKPLRGGGGAGAGQSTEYAAQPALAGVQAQEAGNSGKRSSWFFNKTS